jgi:polyphenol oxidase
MGINDKSENINWLVNWEKTPESLVKYSFGFEGKSYESRSTSHDLTLVHQVHGTTILKDSEVQNFPQSKADGIYTGEGAYTLGIKTADCLPLLLINKDNTFAVALHCGWRSLVSGILQKGLRLFEEKNISSDKILCLMGPAISQNSFEVGPEVVEAFTKSSLGLSNEELRKVIIPGKKDRSHIHLSLTAVYFLLKNDLIPNNIYVDQTCTVKNMSYSSFRREKDKRGINYSWVKIKS